MEPEVARRGEANMPEDHMYTYLTLALLSEQPVSVSRIGISIAAAAARMDFFIPMLLSFLLKYHNPLFLSICVM